MFSRKVYRTLLIVTIVIVLIGVASAGFYFGFSYVLAQNERFERLETEFEAKDGKPVIDETTPGAIEIVIPRSSDTKQIAEILEEEGIINNTLVFTLLSKFNGFDGAYLAGTHYVKKDMNYDELMYVLTLKPHAVTVTFPEGFNYFQIKQRLKEKGVNFDEGVLDNMMRSPNLFLDYDFVKDIRKTEGRDYVLEGYLWPDTYNFDMNTDEETIIRTFLNNTERKLIDEYYEQAKRRGMSMDEVLTLASIVQNETTQLTEMRKVSGVFDNRLKRDTGLQSCATINYLRRYDGLPIKLWLFDADIEMYADNKYNTYRFKGLTPGPISSPGDDAIRAALWPEKHNYLYFVATGDEEGTNDFSRTLAEHEQKVLKYSKAAGVT
ncbi:MAG: endolytic transglycosylase MltG [Saccharofermentanales bacterium]|jgi:UPF0755 protein